MTEEEKTKVELSSNGQSYKFESLELRGRKPKALQEKLGEDASIILAPIKPTAETIATLIAWVGPDLFMQKLFDNVLRQAASDAYCEAITEDNKLNQAKYIEEYKEYFKPTARKAGGPKKSDLQKEIAERNVEFMGCFEELSRKNPQGRVIDENNVVLPPDKLNELQMRTNRIFLAIKELQTKLEAKVRTSRKKEAAEGVTA